MAQTVCIGKAALCLRRRTLVEHAHFRVVGDDGASPSGMEYLSLLAFGDGFTEIENKVSNHRPSGEFADLEFFVAR